jgi:imidazoleglycerol-phosphate dehydratase
MALKAGRQRIGREDSQMGRNARITRNTKETQIVLSLDLDRSGTININTGIGFFDHMLTHIGFHGRFDLEIKATGDLEVDNHHTIEDVGLCLGQAIKEALGDKKGIVRYGNAFVPMDEALAQVVLDISGRPYFCFAGQQLAGPVGGFDLQLAQEFWRAVASRAGLPCM